MNRKNMTFAIIAVFAIISIAPLLSEDSSAMTEKTGRASTMYITSGSTTVPENFEPTRDDVYYMIRGSEKQIAMELYLHDHENATPLEGDDREELQNKAGAPMDIYVVSRNGNMHSLWIGDRGVTLSDRLGPYGITIYTEPNDVVKIKTKEAKGVFGDSIWYIDFTKNGELDSVYNVGSIYRTEMKEGGPITMNVRWLDNDLYANVVYEIDVSSPNGSATQFAAVCIIIAALAAILMVVAVMKPKWAK